MTGTDDQDEPFRPPLPQEDRLWRHPSEVAASQRAAMRTAVAVSTVKTPLRHAVGLATVGALGGALVVSGLFLTLGGSPAETPTEDPVYETLAVDPIVPIAQPVPAERWPTEVAAEVQPGVAQIVVKAERGTRYGSGVMFRTDGFLLTSHDLVADSAEVAVVLPSGDSFEGEVLGADPISGLAVVRIDERDAATARLAIVVPPPEVGDNTVVVAARVGNRFDMSSISALDVSVPVDENMNLHGLIQLSGGMPAGGSGAAVADDTGSVIGVVVDVDVEHGTYAVPIGYARKIAEDLLTDGRARHSWLGIRGVDLEAEANELTNAAAVRVQSVITDSPAHRIGLRQGNIITAINDTAVTSMSQLILELRRHVPGERVEIAVYINGKKYLKTVELDARAVDATT